MDPPLRRVVPALRRRTGDPATRADAAVALLLVLLVTGAALAAALPVGLPSPVPATAPPTVFSSGRALAHIRVIAQQPHPLGSPANAAVREYLVHQLAALGLQPEVQHDTAAGCCFGGFVAGTPANVLARLRGTERGKAVLLVAHYDSVPTGPGASDDGAGVAALLETLRALTVGPPLRNDLIVLFTDGEERGLLGAFAFVARHRWADEVGVVLNLEARGHTGAARLFETSDRNGWLIRQVAAAVPYPVANSASAAGYRLSGSDTDLSVFLRAGRAGLNVAYTEGLTHYHTALDSVDELDERSVQHLGSYALALARQFGNADLAQPRAPEAVYFSLFRVVVHYPQGWALPLALGVALTFVAVTAFGYRRGQLTLGGVAVGFLALLGTMLAVPLAVALLWALLRARYPGSAIWALEYAAELFWGGFASLTVAATAALYNGFRRAIRLADLAVGALLWHLLALLLTSILFPPASFGATWPLLCSLLGLAALFALGDQPPRRWHRGAALALSAIPAMLIAAPAVSGVTLVAGLLLPPAVPVFALVLVLVLGLLLPQLALIARPHRWALPGALAALGLGLVLTGGLTAGFDARQPRPNSLVYALNADTGQAIWASFDEAPDPWTAQVLGSAATKGAVADYPVGTASPLLHRQAPAVALAAPELALLDDSVREGVRTLRLRITAPPQATLVRVVLDTEAEVVGAAVNGQPLPHTTSRTGGPPRWTLTYWNPPPDGVELTLAVAGTEPLTLTATAGTPGLPPVPGMASPQRPPDMLPAHEDQTLVSRSVSLAPRP